MPPAPQIAHEKHPPKPSKAKTTAVNIAKAAGGAAVYAALSYLHAHYPAFFPN